MISFDFKTISPTLDKNVFYYSGSHELHYRKGDPSDEEMWDYAEDYNISDGTILVL